MASELSWRGTATGATDYVTIRNAARQYWNTSGTPAFETLTVANWANYKIALTESPASSYFYVGTWPATLATVGWYWVDVYKQVGGGAAISDTFLGTLLLFWDGATAKPWGADTTEVGGTVQTGRDLGLALPAAAPGAAGGLPTTDGTKLSQTADLTAGQTIAATVAGDIGGDVAGKVLGGGGGTITGTGVRAVDGSGNAIAPASATTAIAAQLPAALVGGKIDAHVNDIAAGAITAAAIATDAIDADALAADAVAEIANGSLDLANGIETGLTPRQAQRLLAAALAGKLSGAATATIVIRNAVADDKNRITATVDADGNRSAITVDLT